MDDLWQELLFHLDHGNFCALETALGGPDGFDRRILAWHGDGKFHKEPEMLEETLSCACMLGRTESARYLIDAGVDPYAGMTTWLAGPHYAVSSGRLDTVKMLLEKRIPLEVENRYGGTVLSQALWSAIDEHTDSHAEIIELLLDAGAVTEAGTLEWWQKEPVPSTQTKPRVLEALRRHGAQ